MCFCKGQDPVNTRLHLFFKIKNNEIQFFSPPTRHGPLSFQVILQVLVVFKFRTTIVTNLEGRGESASSKNLLF